MRLARRQPMTAASLAERERALGLDEPAEAPPPKPALEYVLMLPDTPAAPPEPDPAVRITERGNLTAALLAWGDAHDWPRLPLATGERGPYLSLMPGEECWYTFTSNPIDLLRQAGAAIGQMEE